MTPLADRRMARALEVARTTPPGDVPVGAVIYDALGREVGHGVNRREASGDPTAHAEVEALRAAARTLGTWRLDGCELVVTLEPCTMCAGAILGARVKSLVFGAFEPKTGAVGSLFDAPPLTRGLVVMAGGLTAFVFSRRIGALADTRGPRPLVVVSLVVAAVAMLGVALAPWMLGVAVFWGVAVLAAQGVQVGVNMLVLRSPAGGQILSTVQAFRFFGNALTPLAVLPVYSAAPLAGFGLSAAMLLVAAGLNARAGLR